MIYQHKFLLMRVDPNIGFNLAKFEKLFWEKNLVSQAKCTIILKYRQLLSIQSISFLVTLRFIGSLSDWFNINSLTLVWEWTQSMLHFITHSFVTTIGTPSITTSLGLVTNGSFESVTLFTPETVRTSSVRPLMARNTIHYCTEPTIGGLVTRDTRRISLFEKCILSFITLVYRTISLFNKTKAWLIWI